LFVIGDLSFVGLLLLVVLLLFVFLFGDLFGSGFFGTSVCFGSLVVGVLLCLKPMVLFVRWWLVDGWSRVLLFLFFFLVL